MSRMQTDRQEKTHRTRHLSTLSSIRKEMARVYGEARTAGADPQKISYFRALTFILSAAADVRKSEELEDVGRRLDALEQERSHSDDK